MSVEGELRAHFDVFNEGHCAGPRLRVVKTYCIPMTPRSGSMG
jgi:hypothetical protein